MTVLENKYMEYLEMCTDNLFPQTKATLDEHRSYFSNNRTSTGLSLKMKELTLVPIIERADGAYFTDIDGNRFLDISMGFGVHLLGHKNPIVDKAISDQLEKGMSLGPLWQDAADVAMLIGELTGFDRSAFYNSGTEAVMVALRIARAATAKSKVVIFENSFHGTFDALLAVKSDKKTKHALTSVPGITQNLVENTIILEFGAPESIDHIQKHSDEIAAVLTEPVQSRNPESLNPEFLKELERISSANNIVLIFDEIITGFRIDNGGAAKHFGVEPDICTYGKVVGGGMPIGVVAGKKHFLDYIDGGKWQYGNNSLPKSAKTFVAGTFCHHPLAMAAAKATLQYLKSQGGSVQAGINEKTTYLCNELNKFFVEEGFGLSIINFGSLFRFQLKGKQKILYNALLKEGVYIWEGRNCFLSSVHGDEEIKLLIGKVKKCAYELAAAGVLVSNRKAKIIRSKQSSTIEVMIKVDELLDPEGLHICLRFLQNTIPALRGKKVLWDLCQLEKDELPLPADRNNFDFFFQVFQNEKSTFLKACASKDICDGWSLTLFFKELAKCYTALQKGICLPTIGLKPQDVFINWLNTEKSVLNGSAPEVFPAATIDGVLDLSIGLKELTNRLFEFMLSAFVISLGEGSQQVGVPMAGQWVSRNLKVFGSCTAIVPFDLDSNKGIRGVMESAKNQMVEAKKNFKEFFPSTNRHFKFVFNYDNLDFDLMFNNVEAELLMSNENETTHDVVFNISKVKPSKLIIHVKYNTDVYTQKDVKEMYASFVETLKTGAKA